MEYERERWRDERDTRRREPAGERAGRRRDEPRNARQPGNAAPQAERPGADFGAAAAATPIWLDRACSPDRDERVAAYLAAIEQRTKPTGDQVREFDALKKAAETAGGLLRGACEIAPALTPTRQIEVVERRAKAVLSAIDALKPALETFYATLDDEQKARFNALPAAPAAGAAPSAAPRATPPPQANSTPSDRVGALQRTYGDGADAESEAGGASEEASQPRRKTRRYRSYRWYYRW